MPVSVHVMMRDLAHRIGSLWRFKLALGLVLTVWFCVPYFTLQHVFLRAPWPIPPLAIDRAIAFVPRWIWVYQSAYLLIAGVPWLFVERDTLIRFARPFCVMSAIGFACFLVVPTIGPRPATLNASGMYALVTWYDGPTNAFPSLHVALATHSLRAGLETFWTMASLRQVVLAVVGAGWVTAVAYAAVATKQHYVVDVLAGFVLALAVRP